MTGRKPASSIINRRTFLRGSLVSALASGLVPGALLRSARAAIADATGKCGLTVLNERPLNAETPAHLLDDEITSAEHFFVRNNGIPPGPEDIDVANWLLTVEGEACEQPKSFRLAELKKHFKHRRYRLVIECGGNGRSEFVPSAPGNQWSVGAVGCAEWTGVRLRDVLESCGIMDSAVYVAYEGADRHLSGDASKLPISRGVPVGKALEDECLIAWAMNDEELPLHNGFPLRLVIGGWPGSVSGKWLTRILIRDRVHDGAKMGGKSYRVPRQPVEPGADVADEQMQIIESMPVKSLVTFPRSGITHELGQALEVRGHAWAGDLRVESMFVSTDFGATWNVAELESPPNRFAWQRWRTKVSFPKPGYYEVWARAVDSAGVSQPMILPGWNPKGYLNNACHRVAVQVV